MIKEIYVDGLLRKDFKTSAVFIDGQLIKDSTKFNIFNRRVLDLDQNSDFTILYTLQVIKTDQKSSAASSNLTTASLTEINEPSKNRSSITINGSSASDSQTLVRISGKLVNDKSSIELFLDGKKVKDSNFTIIIEIKKTNLLKYVRLQKK